MSYNKHVAAALCAALLAACSTSNNTLTPTTQKYANISGDYTGTITSSVRGSATATGTLAQHGASAGGAMTTTVSGVTTTTQMSLLLTLSNTFTGAMVIDFANGTTCTYSTSGTYTPSTAVLSGSFAAVTNCAGETGSYTLNQQCTDTVTSVERRRLTFPAQC